jgi:hypothetical protein
MNTGNDDDDDDDDASNNKSKFDFACCLIKT